MSPENKLQSNLEFQESDQPEEIRSTAEVEATLEQLKDPKYWERKFQTEWEQKAGQEKNWSGIRCLKYIKSELYIPIGILPDGNIVGYDWRYSRGHREEYIFKSYPYQDSSSMKEIRRFCSQIRTADD